VVPQCGEPKLGYSGSNGGQGYSKRILVCVVLGGLSGACLELFCGRLSGGMDECPPARIEGFGEFEILWVRITCKSVRD